MRCKEILQEYFKNFSMNVVYDIVLSCKVCIFLIYIFYCFMMYLYVIPEHTQAIGFSKMLLSLISAAAATVITMPAYLICLIAIGIAIRFIKDTCSGGCLIAKWFRKQLH